MDMTFDLDLRSTVPSINKNHLLIKDNLYTKLEASWGRVFLSYQWHNMWETDMTFDLGLWPTDMNIQRDHLLIKDYLPTKFEVSGAKPSWVIN